MKAICTWGGGEDILVSLEGTNLILYEAPTEGRYVHGTVSAGSVGLTITQAKQLRNELTLAIQEAQGLDESYKAYCENNSE